MAFIFEYFREYLSSYKCRNMQTDTRWKFQILLRLYDYICSDKYAYIKDNSLLNHRSFKSNLIHHKFTSPLTIFNCEISLNIKIQLFQKSTIYSCSTLFIFSFSALVNVATKEVDESYPILNILTMRMKLHFLYELFHV